MSFAQLVEQIQIKQIFLKRHFPFNEIRKNNKQKTKTLCTDLTNMHGVCALGKMTNMLLICTNLAIALDGIPNYGESMQNHHS